MVNRSKLLKQLYNALYGHRRLLRTFANPLPLKNLTPFGEEVKEAESASDKWDIHSYSGFEIVVLKETNKIVSITVEYSANKLTKSNLCYGNINGTSTYDDVYAEMGEPSYNNINYGEVSYVVDSNYINFSFDENMNLTGFTLQLENTH